MSMTGSRLFFWLQAFTSAFSETGHYWCAVVSFPISAPSTRAANGTQKNSHEPHIVATAGRANSLFAWLKAAADGAANGAVVMP